MIRTCSIVTAMFVAMLASGTVKPVQAKDITIGGLKISAPWTRATPKGASVGGGYMTITNTGSTADRLVGGATNMSSRFEIHEMSMDNGVMKMRPLANGIEIKPGQTVEFKPGSYHVMFVGLKGALEQGQLLKATLEFEKAGKVDVEFTIEGIGAKTGGDSAMPGMHMKH
jgi:copper(I)-binding protein